MEKYRITIEKFNGKNPNGYDNKETIYEQTVEGDNTIVSCILSVVLDYISYIKSTPISINQDGDKR